MYNELNNYEKEGYNMADCPRVRFDDSSTWYSDCGFICSFTGQRMGVDDPKVKYVCKAEYGEEYKKCPIYQRYA